MALPGRGPGRPPKANPAPLVERLGIVGAPSDGGLRLECVYDQPGEFKSLFAFLKSMHSEAIVLRFTPSGMTFFAYDQNKRNRICAHVAGAQVNIYYCDCTFWIQLQLAEVEKIFNCTNNTMYKVSWRQRATSPGRIHITFKEHVLESECHYQLKVQEYAPDPTLEDAENSSRAAVYGEYPLVATFPWKSFKQTIGRVGAISKELTMEKMGEEAPIQYAYSQVNGMQYNEVYRDSTRFELASKVGPSEAFRCRFLVADVKAVSGALLAPKLTICFDSEHDLIFRSQLGCIDLTVVTKTLLAA